MVAFFKTIILACSTAAGLLNRATADIRIRQTDDSQARAGTEVLSSIQGLYDDLMDISGRMAACNGYICATRINRKIEDFDTTLMAVHGRMGDMHELNIDQSRTVAHLAAQSLEPATSSVMTGLVGLYDKAKHFRGSVVENLKVYRQHAEDLMSSIEVLLSDADSRELMKLTSARIDADFFTAIHRYQDP
jgi:hypothetical protein